MGHIYLEFINLFCAGILAGIEFTVCFGLRAPLAVLDQQPQIQIRQSLIRRLRVRVPPVFFLTAISGVSVAILEGTATGFVFRCVGVFAVLTWTLATFTGTVPINKALLTWQPDAPPANWKSVIKRWERLDAVRTGAALAAFASFSTAVALRLSESSAGQ
jgi:uncharacterized membrane protein